jgi:Tol biopolymer transport system component
MIGKTLGHYEITSQLGKGGMGEVYQAKDQKLGRDVAIKVLPVEFAKDADRVARFQREAKLLASLNHPNIAAIHGLEESAGANFLVLELVKGETLADRIKAGPIPIEESLRLALQIAEALEAAHEKGVIHRDLKPANIKITPEGKVKVLDFGLAKAFAGEQSDLNLSNSPTISNAATQQGVILGTAAYMSPEQARGKSVDKKTDIWAFGCVLYEMLTGNPAFSGTDVTEILAAVIRAEPEWSNLPANLQWRMPEVLERCLKKETRDRYHDIADVRADIQKALTDNGRHMIQGVETAGSRKRLGTMLPWFAVLFLTAIVAVVATWILKPAPPDKPQPVTRLFCELPKAMSLGNAEERAFAVSPDSRKLVYGSRAGLYVRSMEDLEAKLIPGTGENPTNPVFSPDGKWIAYLSGDSLKKIAITGGLAVDLMPANFKGFFSWGKENAIISGGPKGIMRISPEGGVAENIIRAAEEEFLISPQILPDGDTVLFTRALPLPHTVMVQSIKSGKRKKLFPGDSAHYLAPGYIIYTQGNDIFAIGFNPDTLEKTGGSVPLVQDILRGLAPQYDVSDSGALAYVPETSAAAIRHVLVWVDRNGKEQPIPAPPSDYGDAKLSPDGTKIAVSISPNFGGNISIWDLARGTLSQLTFEGGNTPIWSGDGKKIAYTSFRENIGSIYWKNADGTGKEERLSSTENVIFPFSWSKDHKTLVLAEFSTSQGSADIGAISLEGDGKWRPLLKEKFGEGQPTVSPDGRWLAYTSNESGRNQVYVRPFPDVDSGRWHVSTEGGDIPLWSRDGGELFYRNGDAIMAVTVKTGSVFSPGTPRVLFKGNYVFAEDMQSSNWDISLDGKQFLLKKDPESKPAASGTPGRINIVLNWLEELKQRVPTGKK